MPPKLAESVACLAALVFLAVVTSVRVWSDRRRLGSAVQYVISCWPSCGRKPSAPDPLERRVLEACRERQVECAREVLALANFVHLATLSHHTYRVMAGVSDVAMWNVPQFVVAMVMMGCAGVLSLCPQILSHRAVSAMSSFINALLAVFTALGDYAELGTHEHRAHILATCVFWCAFDLQPGRNAVRMATVLASLVVKANSANEASLGIIVVFVAAYLLLSGIHYLFMKSVRLEICAVDSGNEMSAVKILLGAVCDVVVELDSDLRFVQHSRSLAAILLQGVGHSIQGARLQDFLHGEDAHQEVARRLVCSDKASAMAHVFHANMRDSSGSSIAMEFFSVAFRGSDTCWRHLVGMREFTDVLPVMRPLESRWTPVHPPQAVRPRWHGTPAAQERGEIDAQLPCRESSPAPSRASSPSARSSAPSSAASSTGPAERQRDDEAGERREPAERPVRETSYLAKKVTLCTTILGWRTNGLESACCPMHALALQAQRTTADILSEGCNPAFQMDTGWQCERCGIALDEYRIKRKGNKCQLCKDVHDDAFLPRTQGEHVQVPL